MLEFLRNVLIIVVALKIGFSILKFLFSSKARKKSAVFYRLKKIVSNLICIPLDCIIRKQEKKAEARKPLPNSTKVIKFPNAK